MTRKEYLENCATHWDEVGKRVVALLDADECFDEEELKEEVAKDLWPDLRLFADCWCCQEVRDRDLETDADGCKTCLMWGSPSVERRHPCRHGGEYGRWENDPTQETAWAIRDLAKRKLEELNG